MEDLNVLLCCSLASFFVVVVDERFQGLDGKIVSIDLGGLRLFTAFPIFDPLHQVGNFLRASFLAAALILVREVRDFNVFHFFFGLVLVASEDCFEKEELWCEGRDGCVIIAAFLSMNDI